MTSVCLANSGASPPAGTTIRRVTDFGDDHPEFRVQLATGPLDTDPHTRKRERVEWRRNLEERSGLAFSHLRHVGQIVPNPVTRSKLAHRSGPEQSRNPESAPP